MTPTPRSKSESKRLAITGKEGEEHDKYEAALAEDARREAMPPDLREMKRLVHDLLDLWLSNSDETCFCVGDVPGERSVPCEICGARLALGKLTDSALELDEKRVALDSRRRAALEDVATSVRFVYKDYGPFMDANNPGAGSKSRLEDNMRRLDALTPTQEKE